MNLKKYNSQLVVRLIFVFLIIFFLSIYFLSSSIKEIVNIIIVSFSLSYTLNPIRDFLTSKFNFSKQTSSMLVICIVTGIFAGCIIIIIPSLFNEIDNVGKLFDSVSTFFDDSIKRLNLNDFPIADSLYNEILEKGNSIWNNISNNALNNLGNISSNIISFAVIPIVIYYFLCDGNKIYKKLLLILPTKKREIAEEILSDIDRVLTRYISSQLVLCGLVGILTFILLIILKVKFPLWISILNAILNIIPYFGPIFGMVPATVAALLDSPVKAVWVLIGMFIIQQIEGNILSPKITGDSTDMHPFVIIILLLIGEKFGGFIGMILVVPIAVIIKVLYDDINYYLF